MTMFDEPEEHYIPDWYLSALINGDYSSFDYYYNNEVKRDREIERFDTWVKEAQAGRQGHWAHDNDEDESDAVEWRRGEISGLYAMCARVLFIPMKEELSQDCNCGSGFPVGQCPDCPA